MATEREITLTKGVRGCLKLEAMFSCVGDVGAALREVGALDRELEKLRAGHKLHLGQRDAMRVELADLRNEVTGARAGAAIVKSDADAYAAAVKVAADDTYALRVRNADIRAGEILTAIQSDRDAHAAFMEATQKQESELQGRVDALEEELAAIAEKAKL